MKTKITSIVRLLLLLCCIALANRTLAQTPTYVMKVTNITQCAPNILEFDVFLLNTSPGTPLELQTVQFGLGYDISMLGGGTTTNSIVTTACGGAPSPSELKAGQAPTAVNLPASGATTQFGGVSYRWFNCSAKSPQGSGPDEATSLSTTISTVDGGCTHPGTRIARYRLTNSIPFVANARPKFIFSTATGTNRTNTIVQAYVPAYAGLAVNLTALSPASNVPGNFAFPIASVNYQTPGTCDPNNKLNATCSAQPTADAGADFSTCGDAFLHGLIGGTATVGTWSSPTGGTFTPSATALNATYHPSAQDLTNGSVTLTLSTNNPEGAPCVAAVDQVVVSFTPIPPDGNPCTSDGCDPLTGNPVYTPLTNIGGGATDNLACTSDDCVNGTTVNNVIVVADDNNPCTAEGCVEPTGVFHTNLTNIGGGATDNNACTSDDCVNGVTVNNAIPTDDGNPCTTDGCTDPGGPFHNPTAAGTPGASDNNVCTNDVCDGNGNTVNNPVATDDGNPCTADGCTDPGGVFHNNLPDGSAGADDNNGCTNDVCVGGVTTHPTVDVDDQNPCTVDACTTVPGAPSSFLLTRTLSYPTFTNSWVSQTSQFLINSGYNSVGLTSTGWPTGSTVTDFSMTTGIAHTYGGDIYMVITGNPSPAIYLKYPPTSTMDASMFGAGPGGTVPTLPYTWSMTGGAFPASPGAGVPYPIPSPGPYLPEGNAGASNDFAAFAGLNPNRVWGFFWADPYAGDGGTIDNVSLTITVALPTSVANITHTPLPEINDGNACTDDACDTNNGAVTHTPVATDDSNPCTTDGCNSVGGVFHTPTAAGTPGASDNNLCTDDVCDGNGNTVNNTIPTDDGNPCTTDGCTPTGGAFHTPLTNVGGGASDNNVCTSDDCVNGSTVNNTISTDDSNPCTTDGCDPVSGPYHTPTAAGTPGASDNNLCTDDVCDGNGATVHTAIAGIDDNNLCTDDRCDAGSGVISHPPIAGISDNNLCTDDVCDPLTGTTTHTPIASIDDNNLCTDDVCNPLTGITTHNPYASISDGDPCTIDNCDPLTGITQHVPNAPTVTAVVSTPIACYGGTACVTVSASGGVTPYSSGTGVFCGYFAGPPPITFDVTDAAGCTATSDPLLITQPAKVTVTTSAVTCSGSTGSVTANASGGSGSYTYQWNPGALSGNPISGLANGVYTVKVTDVPNGCTATSLPFTVSCAVATCSAPGAISGPQGVCAGQTNVVFCVAAVPGALSYTWTKPAHSTFVGSSTGNCITLSFDSYYNGGSLCVKSVCASGPSATSSCINVPKVSYAPSTPGAISGPSPLCPNTCAIYSVSAVSGATSYVWAATGGLTISSGQGTNSVKICASSTFTSGTISVYAKNCKGNSGTRTKNVTGKPGTPTWQNSGGDNVAVGACAGSTIPYEISGATGVNVWVWSAPAGAIIYDRRGHSGNPLTVTGTDPVENEWEVDIKFPSGFVSGTVSVYGQNACGNGSALSMTVQSKPSTPGAISGSSTACKRSSASNVKCYSIAAVPGATSYTWTASNGATIYSGQGTTYACVKFKNATSSSVTITVKANNSCGSSSTSSKIVTVSNCKTAADGTEIEVSDNALSSLTAYPNPTAGKARIAFTSDREAKYSLKVVDVIGRVLISENISAVEGYNEKEINLENVAKGLYLVSVQTEGGEAQTLRLVVE